MASDWPHTFFTARLFLFSIYKHGYQVLYSNLDTDTSKVQYIRTYIHMNIILSCAYVTMYMLHPSLGTYAHYVSVFKLMFIKAAYITT